MQIPDRNTCYRLMCEMKMFDHIVCHSLQVCRVALFLTDQLRVKGIDSNDRLIRAAALLHDITKTRSFDTDENHALTGGQLLAELGYPEVGDLVRQHVRLDEYFALEAPDEAQIINYADKRVLHDRIVTFGERMDYIIEKYGKASELQRRLFKLKETTLALESKIFNNLGFAPDDLVKLIQPQDCSVEFIQYRQVCKRFSNGK